MPSPSSDQGAARHARETGQLLPEVEPTLQVLLGRDARMLLKAAGGGAQAVATSIPEAALLLVSRRQSGL